jgi:hypothetical protein
LEKLKEIGVKPRIIHATLAHLNLHFAYEALRLKKPYSD